jgi:Lipase (class 3)
MHKTLFFFYLLLISIAGSAQLLKPGFDKEEYRNLMRISAQFGDSAYRVKIPLTDNLKFNYRSAVVGLDNTWELYTINDKIPVISIRGTTQNSQSWLANFYAAMIPAKGSITIGTNDVFQYELGTHSQAAVHTGWVVSLGYLSKTILPAIDSIYKSGKRDLLIIGHSQGGAIAYLLNAQLMHMQKKGSVPADLRIKTYCSAAPKPGNLQFAYEYEAMVQGGWAFNVVNSADWVPEVPISIQTLDDFNTVNPFAGSDEMISKQKFPTKLALRYAYNRMSKPTKKAQRNFQKYLGNYTSKIVKKNIPGFEPPVYYESNHFVRTGPTIVLKADEEYFKIFPNDQQKIFNHHFHEAYLTLLDKLIL